jgi:hypothetical protein
MFTDNEPEKVMRGLGLVTTLITIGTFGLSPDRIGAQNANLYYSHRASKDTASNPRLSYLLSGERTGDGPRNRHPGQPPRLEVPLGSKTCVQIEDSNLLLYDYTIESKSITIASPEGYDAILAGLAAILPAAKGVTTKAAPTTIDAYTEAVNHIVAAGKKLDGLKKASDVDSINYTAADSAKADADKWNTVANSFFDSDSTNVAFRLLRSVQVSALSAAYTLYKEFSDARALGAPQYCVDIKDSPVHVTLKATRKQVSEQHPRPTGDVVGVDVEPINEKQFEILPVGIVTFAVPGAETFFLDSQQRVQEKPDRGAYFPSAGALAAFRLSRLVWIGAAVAKGQSGTPDSFLGFVFRNPSVARFLVLGIGAGFASVPTDVEGGAAINSPLPANKDLSSVIKKSVKVGLSLIISMTGLSSSK